MPFIQRFFNAESSGFVHYAGWGAPVVADEFADTTWVNYNDLTTTLLGIMVSKGNHPQMGLKNSLLLKMAIEIVDFPIKHGDFPMLNYQRVPNKIGDCNLFGGDWNHGFFFLTFQKQLGMECHHPNWLSLHHFSEGVGRYTTNQITIVLPSDKRLRNYMERSTMLFSWVYKSTTFRLGHGFKCTHTVNVFVDQAGLIQIVDPWLVNPMIG